MHINLPQQRFTLLFRQLHNLALHALERLHRRIGIVRVLQEFLIENFLEAFAVVFDDRFFLDIHRRGMR